MSRPSNYIPFSRFLYDTFVNLKYLNNFNKYHSIIFCIKIYVLIMAVFYEFVMLHESVNN